MTHSVEEPLGALALSWTQAKARGRQQCPFWEGRLGWEHHRRALHHAGFHQACGLTGRCCMGFVYRALQMRDLWGRRTQGSSPGTHSWGHSLHSLYPSPTCRGNLRKPPKKSCVSAWRRSSSWRWGTGFEQSRDTPRVSPWEQDWTRPHENWGSRERGAHHRTARTTSLPACEEPGPAGALAWTSQEGEGMLLGMEQPDAAGRAGPPPSAGAPCPLRRSSTAAASPVEGKAGRLELQD